MGLLGVCICVCEFASVHVCACVCMPLCVHTSVSVCVCACKCMHAHVSAWVCMVVHGCLEVGAPQGRQRSGLMWVRISWVRGGGGVSSVLTS